MCGGPGMHEIWLLFSLRKGKISLIISCWGSSPLLDSFLQMYRIHHFRGGRPASVQNLRKHVCQVSTLSCWNVQGRGIHTAPPVSFMSFPKQIFSDFFSFSLITGLVLGLGEGWFWYLERNSHLAAWLVTMLLHAPSRLHIAHSRVGRLVNDL